jgi:hypothetical protein
MSSGNGRIVWFLVVFLFGAIQQDVRAAPEVAQFSVSASAGVPAFVSLFCPFASRVPADLNRLKVTPSLRANTSTGYLIPKPVGTFSVVPGNGFAFVVVCHVMVCFCC